MESQATRKDTILIGSAFVLALLLRLVYLNANPLTDAEATWALQAFHLAKGNPGTLGPQPLYLMVTSTLFFLFGNDNFLARLLPAITGSLLTLAPLLFSNKLGRGVATWLAFGLALDPGLVALSREAGSSVPAITFNLLMIGFLFRRTYSLAGICSALALMGGTELWPGWIGIGLTGLITAGWFKQRSPEATNENRFKPGKFLLAWVLTLLIVGTLFFRVPEGISTIGSSLTTFIKGWGQASGISPLTILAGIGFYALLALPLAIWTGIRAWMQRDVIDQTLTIWFVIALAIAITYPSRRMSTAAWVIIPLWGLAARGLVRLPKAASENRLATNLFTLIAMVILFFTWLSFTSFLQAWQTNTTELQVRGLALTGGLVMLALATILVAWGWSTTIAGMGVSRAALLMLLIYLVSGTSSAIGWLPQTTDLWESSPQPKDQSYLLETVGDISLWNTGRRDAIEMVVAGVSSPSLRWTLRNFPNARFNEALQPGSQPPLVLTPEAQQPELAASYRGQAFVWDISPDWSGMTLFDQLNWLAFHTAPTRHQMTILWARTDLFLDRNAGAPSTTSSTP